MTTLEFAQKHVRFGRTSPITGAFRLELYPFLAEPMAAADDLAIKRSTIFKASSSLGTVIGQILNAKRIVCDVGDQLMVCQTDSDAEKWTKTRGKEWLEAIPDVMRLLKNDKYAQTNELWLFRHKFLSITGPGINSAQSVQVRYVQTDEAHLEAYPNGRLVEFEKRMGGRWDRQGTHITTAPSKGREVEGFFNEACQKEFNWRCPKCNDLVWALWQKRALDRYNGERIFHWRECQSENETLDSIVAICPHCQHESKDVSRDRYALVRNGAYLAENPTAPSHLASFRWSVFNSHWIPWRELLSEYKAAERAAVMNDLKPYEDFVKKRECMVYDGDMPDIHAGGVKRSYALGTIELVEKEKRFAAFDVQDGNADNPGLHFWAQCDQFNRDGSSHRIDFQRLTTWGACKEFFERHKVAPRNAYFDATGRRAREVYRHCAEWNTVAMISTDDESFLHMVPNPQGKNLPRIQMRLPYSPPTQEDGYIGTSQKPRGPLGRCTFPAPGMCVAGRWSKPAIGNYLMALKAGQAQSYSIARDINPEYTAQLNSYAYVPDTNKKTGVTHTILKQIRRADHAFATSSLCLLGAIISNFFPLAQTQEQTQAA